MKVYIGPYTQWVGPYQIAEILRYVGVSEERCDALGAWLNKTWLRPFCEWVESKRSRTISIKIHRYDTWGMDSTLALIILPMLKQLQSTKPGSPYVDDDDVPEHLRSTNAAPLTEDEQRCGSPDKNHHARWAWVMEEMIWAFEQLVDDDADDRFFYDVKIVDGNKQLINKPFDKDGYAEWQDRKQRALTLFGKYFEALWD